MTVTAKKLPQKVTAKNVTPEEKLPQKTNGDDFAGSDELPQKDSKLPQKVTAKDVTPEEKLPQKTGSNPFAGNLASDFAVDDLIDDEEIDDDISDIYANVDKNNWRVETRTYRKKDGTLMLYYNFRRRKSYVNSKGKRIIPYRKGGKKIKERPNGKER